QRVVLVAAAQYLNCALGFRLAADQRIDPSIPRLLIEIDAGGIERAFFFLRLAVFLCVLSFTRLGFLVGAARRPPGIGKARPLGYPVADVIARVVPGHVLLLQEISGVTLAFGKNRDEHIGAGDFFPPRGLNMNDRPLDDTLKSRRRLGVLPILANQI